MGPPRTFTAGVRGAVRESDRVVPGVALQLINEATGTSRETVSNALGEYDFSAVPPATSTIRAALQGFKTYERTGLRVATQQFITVDVRLEVGGLQETTMVSGQAPLLDTTNASIGAVLAAEDLNALPSVARNMYMMSVVVPTAVTSGNQVFTRLQDLNHPSLMSLRGVARAVETRCDSADTSSENDDPVVSVSEAVLWVREQAERIKLCVALTAIRSMSRWDSNRIGRSNRRYLRGT